MPERAPLAKGFEHVKTLERLEVEYVPIGSIRPNAYNPNRMPPDEFELLKNSMREDGFTQPIICQRDVREIVDGEHRWRGAGALGYQEVPVVWVNMSEAQRRVATLRHNRARGVEDYDAVAQVFRELREMGALDYAQEALQVPDADLARMMQDLDESSDAAMQTFGSMDDAWDQAPVAPQSPVQPTSHPGVAEAAPRPSASPSGAPAPFIEPAGGRVVPGDSHDPLDGPPGVVAVPRPKEDIYKLSLIYTGEEAKDVAAILEPRQAVMLLQLCRAESERRKKAVS